MAVSLYSLVEEMFVKHANMTAVLYDTGEQQLSISYMQLKNISARVMNLLQGREGEVVGLCLQLDHRMPAFLLGVLGCKAAFYNFDSKGFMYAMQVMKDLGSQIMLVHQSNLQVIQNYMKEEEAECNQLDVTGLEDYYMIQFTCTSNRKHVSNLAYCITTSGTTGKPKFVLVPNECIVPNILHLRALFSLTSDDLVLAATALTFDPSIVEIFTSLSVGACLLMVPPALSMMPDRLLDIIHVRNKVTVLQVTPTLFSRFKANNLLDTILGDNSAVRVIALGGEKFPSCTWLQSMKSPSNQTCFYNLYGTTEVSCWATFNKVTDTDLKVSEEIPLGKPLQDTVLEVHDDLGKIVTEGTGMLWIGGSRRQCLIDTDEDLNFDNVVMRETGDVVRLQEDGRMYYIGRKDQQRKRNGRRINLEEIKKIARRHDYVHDLEVVLIEDQLVVFIVPSQSSIDTEIVHVYMKDYLPSHWWPDTLITIANLPVTKHGKVDVKALEQIYYDKRIDRDKIGVIEYLQLKWKELTNQTTTCIPETGNFILAGGDSLKAVQLANTIENVFDVQLPQLVDTVLHKTYREVKKYIVSVVQSESDKAENVEDLQNTVTVTDKLDKEDNGFNTETYVESLGNPSYLDQKAPLIIDKVMMVSEAANADGHMIEDESYGEDGKDLTAIIGKVIKKKKHAAVEGTSGDKCQVLNDFQFTLQRCNQHVCMHGFKTNDIRDNTDKKETWYINGREEQCKINERCCLRLEEVWKYDTGKCVDASPLVVVKSSGVYIVMIGSHSHRFSAICGTSGEKLWETTLPDRIESSACLSLCAKYVIVGCYDGSIYFMNVNNGEIWWQFETGSQVKCSPVVDDKTGLVYTGSHSQTVYCLDCSVRGLVWKRNLKSGSIFSSPCISKDPHQLYTVTLGGKMFTLDPSSGETKWKYTFSKPVFSSPAVTSTGVCVGCTDMSLYCFSFDGMLLWKYSTNGHIFSSPSFYRSSLMLTSYSGCAERINEYTENVKESAMHSLNNIGEYIVIGCHDNYLYCITNKGELVWKILVDSAVYSSPFQCTIKCDNHKDNCNLSDDDSYELQTPYTSQAQMNQIHIDNDSTGNIPLKPHTSQAQMEQRIIKKDSILPLKPHISEAQIEHRTLEVSSADYSEPEVVQNICKSTSTENITLYKSDTYHNKHCKRKISDKEDKIMTDSVLHVAVFATTAGYLYVVHVPTGVVLCKQHLHGEIFSSPVVYENIIVVGCRNDFVYCLKILCGQN